MPHLIAARYHARDGTQHLITVQPITEGRWRVLDTVAGTPIVVETITGDDGQVQAQALARDYLAERQAFQLGLRAHDPLPKPEGPPDRGGAAMGSVITAQPGARHAGSARPAAYGSTRSAMRIVRPQPAGLRCRVRLADGRVFTGALPPDRHRAIQLGMLHADAAELVELTPGTRSANGRLELDRRRRVEHYLPGGAGGREGWLEALLAHAERIVAGAYASARLSDGVREEAFVGVAPAPRRGDKHAIAHTRFLWVDVDHPDRLGALWALLAKRPCQLLIASGGSGGAHAYWKLAEPLAATRVVPATGELVEPIERAHLRLIHHLGVDGDGRPDVADIACKERSRVMRVAGSVNWKSGRYARVVEADFALPGYRPEQLVGDLPDPSPTRSACRPAGRIVSHEDPYKRIAPPVYFQRLAGITVPRNGLVSCPVPAHDDRHPSCSVGTGPDQGWCCHAACCGARGSVYDLASVLLGGPWGPQLRGEAFTRARARVTEVFGDVG